MSAIAIIGSLVFLIGALFLAIRGLRGHDLPAQTWFKYALTWGIIIVGVVLLLRLFISA